MTQFNFLSQNRITNISGICTNTAIINSGKVKHKLRVQIHELRVQIYELQVQIHELRIQIHELED